MTKRAGGRSPGEPGDRVVGARGARPRKKKRAPRPIYTPEERRAAVEAYLKSGMTQEDFSRTWGVSQGALGRWYRRHKKYGPKGLERKPDPRKGSWKVPKTLRGKVAEVATRYPWFGLKRIRDHLYRFWGLRISTGSIRKTLKEEVPVREVPVARKKRKKRKVVRRFERAKPGSLWQSDITSYVLTRYGQRAYLTVFLDDYSRYVVSWAIALHQKAELVTEALLMGIDRFGKPKEVLTDQGRQYFSWRGKSGFQKLLERQGIKHVIARSHHPQTVGKCERLWGTIGEEFWTRVQPQDLKEARERLGHYFAHYNHSRPHQGIDGMVPADRFFGAEDEVRGAIEETLEENELRLALGETPRAPVYLVGQIGEEQVSLHGERGQVVVHTPRGITTLAASGLGMRQEDEQDGDRTGTAIVCENTEDGGGASEGGDASSETQTEPVPMQTGEDQEDEDAGAGEVSVGGGKRGGAREGAQDSDGVTGDVAWEGEPGGSSGEAERGAVTDLAAEPTGGGGNGGSVSEAAETSYREGTSRRECDAFACADREVREAALTNGKLGEHPARAARAQVSEGATTCESNEYQTEQKGQSEEGCKTEVSRIDEQWHRPSA